MPRLALRIPRISSFVGSLRRRDAFRSRAAVLAAAALVSACGSGGSSSNGPSPAPDLQVRLTGASPWADGCDGVAPTGTVYPGPRSSRTSPSIPPTRAT